MKILLTVELYNPHKGGAEKVVEDLAVGLSGKGHDVTVATTYAQNREKDVTRGVKIEQFKLSGNSVNGIDGESKEVKRYKELILGGGFDLIFNYAAQSWPTDLTFSMLDKLSCKKVLAPVGYSRLSNRRYREYFSKLPTFGRENDLGEKEVIIQNGALEKEFANGDNFNVKEKLGIKSKYLLVAVSHHNAAKGHRFVIKAFRKMKRNDSTLLIIGDKAVSFGARKLAHFFIDYLYCSLFNFLDGNIVLANGRNRRFVLSAYRQSDLALSGSRVECAPLVMYESFASKTPFITTDVGNVNDHRNYLRVVKSPNDMAEAANYLLNNPIERSTMADNAFKLWKDNYTVEKIVGKYEDLFVRLCDGGAKGK